MQQTNRRVEEDVQPPSMRKAQFNRAFAPTAVFHTFAPSATEMYKTPYKITLNPKTPRPYTLNLQPVKSMRPEGFSQHNACRRGGVQIGLTHLSSAPKT